MDQKKLTALILLDLSSAFDTVAHRKLLNRLQKRYGITESALSWISSYLHDRTQSVHVNSATSQNKKLSTGVPQGSVLGPILFNLYMAPVADIARRHGVNLHSYADDTQLYLSFMYSELDNTIAKINKCLEDIRKWLFCNFLKLNDDKTEFLIISSRYQNSIQLNSEIEVGTSQVHRSENASNLGVVFDRNMTTNKFVTNK